MQNNYLRCYLIADTGICSVNKIITLLPSLVAGGVRCVQLRMKNSNAEEVCCVGKEMLRILKNLDVPLIINDYVIVTKKIGAAGVHIGQNDMSYQEARKIIGPNKIIGLSIENIQQAKDCHALPVNYFGVGPVFATSTKEDASPFIGVQLLQQIQTILAPSHTVAIGGININNCAKVIETGVSGIAVASGILSAPNPLQILQEMQCVLTIPS